MATGTVRSVNKAMMRPILMGGVERQLVLMNALLAFPLIAATHFRFPVCFVGIAFFIMLHVLLRMISKRDPHLGKLFKRSTRYSLRSYFAVKSHPRMIDIWTIKSISRSK